jgi:hypothetical protein
MNCIILPIISMLVVLPVLSLPPSSEVLLEAANKGLAARGAIAAEVLPTAMPTNYVNILDVQTEEIPQVNPALRADVRAFLRKRSAQNADLLETKTLEEYIVRPLLKYVKCSGGNHGCDPQSTYCVEGLSRWFRFKCVCKEGYLPIDEDMAKCKPAAPSAPKNVCNPGVGCTVCSECCNTMLVRRSECDACAANVCG